MFRSTVFKTSTLTMYREFSQSTYFYCSPVWIHHSKATVIEASACAPMRSWLLNTSTCLLDLFSWLKCLHQDNSYILFRIGGARVAQWVRSLDLTTHTSLSPIRRGFAPGFVNYKKGALDSQPQVIQFTSCLPMVGGSLRVPRLPPPLKLVAMI